ncbi:NnrS family protein [Dyella telluris]|uniref:NnrS family protein n=1 Tax=Dyella telluris TaxID=2763498 RepID=A0A7G8Q345_9GAMM|nr:NnrS family protein [Dyella telluris]QNK01203.1 NnrS family protein [Dyella telluris]
MPSSPPSTPASIPAPVLLAAPHRAMFFAGATLLVAGMAWWLWVLLASWRGWPIPAQPLPVGWTHGILMQYATLAPFIMGFLLTVFPRWMNVDIVPKRTYVAVFALMLAGAATVLSSACLAPRMLPAGLAMMLLGWFTALGSLATRLHRHGFGDTWAMSAWCALAMGAVGLALALCASLGAPVTWIVVANRIGTFGFLLPVYFTVAHRMVPFFSGNVVAGYRVVRPAWSLWALWALAAGHLALDLSGLPAWRWLADAPLTALLLWQWLAWQPWKARRPGLLLVLYIALAWLPLSFLLYTIDSLQVLATTTASRALAPLHALTIGFFSAMLVAMVTRVTHGHSGRPLAMGPVPWMAFLGMQLVALIRVVAEYISQPWPWYIAAAALWLLALTPWAARSLWIYLTPRRDGAPG